tara:strand:- start:40 stop:231 length:192 start_codon:yes stop_codon:yes gene_type:complete
MSEIEFRKLPKYSCKDHGQHSAVMNVKMSHGPLEGDHQFCMLCIVDVFDKMGIERMVEVEEPE